MIRAKLLGEMVHLEVCSDWSVQLGSCEQGARFISSCLHLYRLSFE